MVQPAGLVASKSRILMNRSVLASLSSIAYSWRLALAVLSRTAKKNVKTAFVLDRENRSETVIF